jgi:hypothetical protein
MSKIMDQFLIGVTRRQFFGIPILRDKQGMLLCEQIINHGEIKDEKIAGDDRSFAYSQVNYAEQADGSRVQVMMTILIDATIPDVKKAETKPDSEN